MQAVRISEQGIVKNILSLNYNFQTTTREYLQNVLKKNLEMNDESYSIDFKIKQHDTHFMYVFTETHAIGFKDIDEMRRAFSIADSDRTGANNMGYGLYSPITINKEASTIGLFVQNTHNGAYFSIVYFDASTFKISSRQGRLDELGDTSHPIFQTTEDGTQFIWFQIKKDTVLNDSDEIIGTMKRLYSQYESKDVYITEDWSSEIKELGKFYSDYIKSGASINYGGDQIESIDILNSDSIKKHEKYDISVRKDDDDSSRKEYRIKDNEDNLKIFNKVGNVFGKSAPIRHKGVQEAQVKIIDIGNPLGPTSNRRMDRKIWVKMDGQYIFSEEFSLSCWPNIRIILEIDNDKDNDFNSFISPDPNKSNSKLNPDIKCRLESLCKHFIKDKFPSETKSLSKDKKITIWMDSIGDKATTLCQKCHIVTIRAFDQINVDLIEEEEGEDKKYMCICSKCEKKKKEREYC